MTSFTPEQLSKAIHAAFKSEDFLNHSKPYEFRDIDLFRQLVTFLGTIGHFESTPIKSTWTDIIEAVDELKQYLTEISAEERDKIFQDGIELGKPFFEGTQEDTSPKETKSAKKSPIDTSKSQRAGTFAGNALDTVSTGVLSTYSQNRRKQPLNDRLHLPTFSDTLQALVQYLLATDYQSPRMQTFIFSIRTTAAAAWFFAFIYFFLKNYLSSKEFIDYPKNLLDGVETIPSFLSVVGLLPKHMMEEAWFLAAWEKHSEDLKRNPIFFAGYWDIGKAAYAKILDFTEYIEGPKPAYGQTMEEAIHEHQYLRTISREGLMDKYYKDVQAQEILKSVRVKADTLDKIVQSVVFRGPFQDKYHNVGAPVLFFTIAAITWFWWSYYHYSLAVEYCSRMHNRTFMDKWSQKLRERFEENLNDFTAQNRGQQNRIGNEDVEPRIDRAVDQYNAAHNALDEELAWNKFSNTPRFWEAARQLSIAVEELAVLEDDLELFGEDVTSKIARFKQLLRTYDKQKQKVLDYANELDEERDEAQGQERRQDPNSLMYVGNAVDRLNKKVEQMKARTFGTYRPLAQRNPTEQDLNRFIYILRNVMAFHRAVMQTQKPNHNDDRGAFSDAEDVNPQWRETLRTMANNIIRRIDNRANRPVRASAARDHVDSEQVLVPAPRSHLMVDSVFEAFKACKASDL